MPGIVSTAIYIFMSAWEEMFFSYTLGARTVPVGIKRYVQGTAGTQLRYDYMAAASVVITIPIALMFFTLQRHFIRGLTAGAVKQPCHIMPMVPSPSLRPLCCLPQINPHHPLRLHCRLLRLSPF
jgi:ABC-type Fe3+ transport system permease subunit